MESQELQYKTPCLTTSKGLATFKTHLILTQFLTYFHLVFMQCVLKENNKEISFSISRLT